MNSITKIFGYLHDRIGNTNKHEIAIYQAQTAIKELGHYALSEIPIGKLTLGNVREIKKWLDKSTGYKKQSESLELALAISKENYDREASIWKNPEDKENGKTSKGD